MIYDMKVHLYNLMDKIIEDFRAGDITKLEADKFIAIKTINDKNFALDIKIIDEEYRKRKDPKLLEFENLEKNRMQLGKDLEKIEKDHWESIIGKIFVYNEKLSIVPLETVPDE